MRTNIFAEIGRHIERERGIGASFRALQHFEAADVGV
jgi:hypothetical protein